MTLELDHIVWGSAREVVPPEARPAASQLRAFLGDVHLKLAAGLVVSAVASGCAAELPAFQSLFFTGAERESVGFSAWGLALVFSPLAVFLLASLVIRDQTARVSGLLYWTIAALVGGSMGLLAIAYAGVSLVSMFLITACAFGALSLRDYSTKRDLSAAGSFLMVALVGFVIAGFVDWLFRSPPLYAVVNGLGILVFAGLVAADTQRLKMIFDRAQIVGPLPTASDYGALTLYLNVTNLFQSLLSPSRFNSGR